MKVKDFCKLITETHGAETEIVGLVFGPSDIRTLPGGRMKKERMTEFIR